MTIKELVEKFKQFPDDYRVKISGEYSDIKTVKDASYKYQPKASTVHIVLLSEDDI